MTTRNLGAVTVALLFAFLFMGAGSQSSTAEEKGVGGFLLDAALGAGEGAIIGKASGGKAGKGALIGMGTSLGREVIIKPLLQGGLNAPRNVRTTVPPTPEAYQPASQGYRRGVDPYQMGYEEGFQKGYERGFQGGLEANRGR